MKNLRLTYILFTAGILGMALLPGCASRKPVQVETAVSQPYFPPEPVIPTQGDGSTLDRVGNCPTLSADRLRDELLYELNALRGQGGDCMGETMQATPPLQWDPLLAQSAAQHTADMALRGELSGLGADGSEVYQRLAVTGWTGGEVAENFHHGARSVPKLLEAWKLNSTYCQNLFNSRFTRVGAGYKDCYWYVILGE